MNWQLFRHDHVHVLELAGRFDAHAVPAMKAIVGEIVTTDHANLVIQMKAVSFVDSAALGALTLFLQWCREKGGNLVLANLSEPVRIILELTQFRQLLAIAESVVEPVEQLSRQPSA